MVSIHLSISLYLAISISQSIYLYISNSVCLSISICIFLFIAVDCHSLALYLCISSLYHLYIFSLIIFLFLSLSLFPIPAYTRQILEQAHRLRQHRLNNPDPQSHPPHSSSSSSHSHPHIPFSPHSQIAIDDIELAVSDHLSTHFISPPTQTLLYQEAQSKNIIPLPYLSLPKKDGGVFPPSITLPNDHQSHPNFSLSIHSQQ
jgi:hypothetical protein